MSKGSKRRPSSISEAELQENWEAVFGKKKLNVMSDEERLQFEKEREELSKNEKPNS